MQRRQLYALHKRGELVPPHLVCSAVGIYGDEDEIRCAGNLTRGQRWHAIQRRCAPSRYYAFSRTCPDECIAFSERYSLPSSYIDAMNNGDEREDRPQHEDRVASVWGIVGRFARWVGGR